MYLVPKTSLGKWSLGLIVAMFTLFIIGTSSVNVLYGSVPAGNTIVEDILIRPVLAIAMLAGMFSGISAFFTGFIAVIREKDSAFLGYVVVIIGALLSIFLLGEAIFPHN